MLAKKKKIGKKNIKEDKLVTYYSKSLEYFEAYKNQIFIGAAAVVVVIAAIVYFGNEAQKTEVEASAALAKASRMYQSGNYEAAIQGNTATDTPSLEEVADKYSGSEAGEIARVYLANSYFYTGDYDKAIENYEDYSGGNKLYKAAALAGIAACYEAKGEIEKAAKYFRDAAYTYENNASNSQYLLNAAVDYIKVKEYDEAKPLLENLKENYATSEEAREAGKKGGETTSQDREFMSEIGKKGGESSH